MNKPGHFAEAAATKIQAVFRGHKVRANMEQGDSLVASEPKDASSPNASNPTREELEAEFREDDKGEFTTHVSFFSAVVLPEGKRRTIGFVFEGMKICGA